MPNRILKETVCSSENLDSLSLEAEVFFYRLLVNCDDYGRADARPAILLAKCFPLRVGKVSVDQVVDWLGEFQTAGLITIYKAGKEYLQFNTWDSHQQVRSKRSKHPAPNADGAETIPDIRRYHMISDASICPRNPIQSNPIQSESESNPKAPKRADVQTEPNPQLLEESTQQLLEKTNREAQDAWVQTYGDIAWIKLELAKAWAWCKSNKAKAPKSNWDRFVNGWLSRGWENHRKGIASVTGGKTRKPGAYERNDDLDQEVL